MKLEVSFNLLFALYECVAKYYKIQNILTKSAQSYIYFFVFSFLTFFTNKTSTEKTDFLSQIKIYESVMHYCSVYYAQVNLLRTGKSFANSKEKE